MTEIDRKQLRATMTLRRASIPEPIRQQAAFATARHLKSAHFFRGAKRIGAYLSFGNELSVNPLIACAWQQGKEVYVPVVTAGSQPHMRFARLRTDTPLSANKFGIEEPAVNNRDFVAARWLDLVLVPLLAFDAAGNRLGMGAGFYDRCFSFLAHRSRWRKPRLCGAGFACQQADKISAEKWDIRMDNLLTENGLLPANGDHEIV